MKPAICVQNLAKRYLLGKQQTGSYRTLREALVEGVSRPFRRLGKPRSSGEAPEVLWALKDVSFEVKPGEVIGIIGSNGAGKSTLLKILSRITEPTSGRVEIRGRVGSLLEVGTGFHPELTGRENIYLAGAILGMSRREIQKKFDQIVGFAGVERFLETPAKRYSSGMYVRLAFAVAAHLDPEVLIVDEVLAVGDAEFQKKCLGKMQDVSHSGRTVFFVSHNMDVIQRLCGHVLLMQHGRLLAQGSKQEMIARYLAISAGALRPHDVHGLEGAHRTGTQKARFLSVCYTSNTPEMADRLYCDGPAVIAIVVESDRERQVPSLAVSFWTRLGALLVNADTVILGRSVTLRRGRNEIKLHIEQLHLKPGTYVLALWLADFGNPFDFIKQAAEVEVVERAISGYGARPPSDGCVTCSFTVEQHAGSTCEPVPPPDLRMSLRSE